MSVYRSLARMAAVCALNNYLEEPWPTLAGPYIFDSKIEPVEDMKIDRVFPVSSSTPTTIRTHGRRPDASTRTVSCRSPSKCWWCRR